MLIISTHPWFGLGVVDIIIITKILYSCHDITITYVTGFAKRGLIRATFVNI